MTPADDPLTPRPDLTVCDREPIHLPGRVQPHGVLLVADAAGLRVLHVSDNCDGHLGRDAAGLVGAAVDAALGPDAAALLRARLDDVPTDDEPVHLLTAAVPAAGGTRFHLLAHRRHGRLLLELEPAAAEDASGASRDPVHRQASASALRLLGETTVRGLLDAATREVRRLTGFDRVMAYRFGPGGHGEVVAEDRADDWHSYLGHRFPASDIPQQARHLYLRNRVRLIPDAGYRPADVLPPDDPDTGQPLDLTYAALRSVSPVHVEYLRNMGVAASMSVSVVVDGRLWGLIACHHRTPHFVPHDVRDGCDHVGRVVAAHLAATGRAEERDQRLSTAAIQVRLLERMAGHADYASGLAEAAPDLLALVSANGVAVAAGGRLHLLGDAPPGGEVARLVDWLAADRPGGYATDRLAEDYPPAGAWTGAGCGVLSVALGPSRRDRVVWFRHEAARTVVWAGDPDKPVGPTDPQARVHPRRSFEAWTQVVRGRATPWEARHVDAAAAFSAAVVGIVFRKADELAGERRRRAEAEAAGRAKDRHLAFLAHELRGPLTPALLAAAALAADAGLPPAARADAAMIRRNIELTARLADDLLDANRIALGKLELHVAPADVHDLLSTALAMCGADAAAKGVRLDLDRRADRAVVDGDAAKLTQVWTNLLKNAVKFSHPDGTVTARTSDVSATSDAAGGRLRVEVIDAGAGVDADLLPRMFDLYEQGERSVTRQHAGLGLGLTICKGIVEAHGGTIAASSAGRGRGTTLTVELAGASAGPVPTPAGPMPATAAAVGRAAGRRILLVDDHEDTLRVMARLLGGMGHAVTTATGVDTALSAAEAGGFELLISDLGLEDGSGLDLMRELLKRRPIKGIALTGYGTAADVAATRKAGFDAHLTKPVDPDALQGLILDVAG